MPTPYGVHGEGQGRVVVQCENPKIHQGIALQPASFRSLLQAPVFRVGLFDEDFAGHPLISFGRLNGPVIESQMARP